MNIFNRKLEKFQKEALDAHNVKRVLHRVQPLKWSNKLAHSAKTWAQNLANIRTLRHQDLPNEGENIAFVTVKTPDGKKITDMWYNESQNYDFEFPETKLEICHFTQVVWADTKEFGIYYHNVDDECFVVARYNPPGNINGKFKENVLLPYKKMSETIQNTDEENKSTSKLYSDHVSAKFKETITTDLVYLDHYNNQMIDLHNKARKAHGAMPLILNDELRKLAQKLAENLLKNKIGKAPFPEFPDIKYGKSITFVVGKDLPHPRSIFTSWYEGNRLYNFNEAVFNYQNGGFTQMVWKSSKDVGFG
ncbi:hypothetical protein HZS_123, partial [Henneguya salminicola]